VSAATGTGTYNLAINQGATYQRTFVWTTGSCMSGCSPPAGAAPVPVDLTGYTAVMQFRAFPLAPTVLYDASADITLGGTAGTIALNIDATDTETFTWSQGVYDLLMTSAQGVAVRLLQGAVSVAPAVSI